MDSLPPRSPVKTHSESKGEIPSVSELPASFFQTSLNFSSEDFGRKRYQTDSFALNFPNSLHSGFDAAFSYPAPSKTASIITDNGKRVQRIRASSFSIPNDLSPFGASIFSSVWSPINPSEAANELSNFEFTDRFAPAVEESDDVNAFSRTIGYLGLDDPLATTPTITTTNEFPVRRAVNTDFNRPRSISVSFPPALEEMNDIGGFSGRALSSMAIMSEGPSESSPTAFKPTSPITNQTWQELTERFQSISSITPNDSASSEKNSGINFSSSVNQDLAYNAENSVPSRSLWIGNIDSAQTADELNQLFYKFGTIESIRMLPEKECAFVNYLSLDDALKAREAMQGSRIGNCIVRIGFGKTEAFHDAQGTNPTKSLWVGNIVPNSKPSDLEAIFSKYGAVESARILNHKNCGFVNFVSLQDAIIARQELNGKDIGGTCIKIGFAKVPHKVDSPITAAQALASPAILATLVPSAVERLSAWQKSSNTNDNTFGTSSPNPPEISSAIESIESIPDSSLYLDNIHILAIPELCPPRKKYDQSRFREYRKKLESQHISLREVDQIFLEIIEDADDLCSDYIGNVVIQKIMEKSGDEHRLELIKKVAPLMAPLGIHKNGTWAVQKIIDLAKQKDQIELIVDALRPFAPALLLDQFGNYVIQCCLRLGSDYNQFIFDVITLKTLEIGQGRFGARATKACLESQHISKVQQRKISLAIVQNCVQLSMNVNGAILLTWLLDGSVLPGRYRVLASIMIPHMSLLACHKLASSSLLKIVMQRNELDARQLVITEIFKENTLAHILSDQNSGIPFITKILSSYCISAEEKSQLVAAVRKVIGSNLQKTEGNLRRLLDELNSSFSSVAKSDEPDNGTVSATDTRSGLYARSVVRNGAPGLYSRSPIRSGNDDSKFTSPTLPTPHQSPNYVAPSYPNSFYN